MSRKCLIAFPERMIEALDVQAEKECRTRSDLIRQIVREYLEAKNKKEQVPVFVMAQPRQEPAPPIVNPKNLLGGDSAYID